jgi:hypothetical protein
MTPWIDSMHPMTDVAAKLLPIAVILVIDGLLLWAALRSP